jgi:hypothetical protein
MSAIAWTSSPSSVARAASRTSAQASAEFVCVPTLVGRPPRRSHSSIRPRNTVASGFSRLANSSPAVQVRSSATSSNSQAQP